VAAPHKDGWRALVGKPLAQLGVRSWLLLGIIGVIALSGYVIALSTSVVVPLLLAIILGIVFGPLVDWLAARRVPRAAAAGLVMLLVLGIVVGTLSIVVNSVFAQMGTIQSQVAAGYAAVNSWVHGLNVSDATKTSILSNLAALAPKIGSWVLNATMAGASSLASLAFGAFIALYMLFFTLKDTEMISHWAGEHLGLPTELGQGIVVDSFSAIRQYFKGTTILAVITSLATALGLWAIGMPLVFAISVVTFVTSYVPFFGAILSGIFAVLIALGAGGVPLAVSALIVVLLAQNVLQQIVASWAIGDALELHPLVVLIATMIGGIFAGLFGGMLGAPVTAIGVRMVNRLKVAWALEDEQEAEREAALEVSPAAQPSS
jgi:putative heme transporter